MSLPVTKSLLSAAGLIILTWHSQGLAATQVGTSEGAVRVEHFVEEVETPPAVLAQIAAMRDAASEQRPEDFIDPTDTSLPGSSLPGTTLPGTTIPGTTIPGTTIPGTTVPGTTLPRLPVPTATVLPGSTIGTSGAVITQIGQIVNIAKQIWTVIQDSQPKATIATDYAVGLPLGVTAPMQLADFTDLKFKSYRMFGATSFGDDAYNVVYTVVHQYGGTYNGKGKYLATVSVIPSTIKVSWGYNVNFKVTNVSTVNVGSATEPVASCTLQTVFTASSWGDNFVSTNLYQFRGDKEEVLMTPL